MWRPQFLLVLAFVSSIIASVVPIALSVNELWALRSSIVKINNAANVARQTRAVAENIALALTDFMAVALDIDTNDRRSILAETDRRVSSFKETLADLKQSIPTWLNERQVDRARRGDMTTG